MPDAMIPEADIKEPVILLTINRLYKDKMTADQLYEATRGNWVIGPDREQAKYAFALVEGIVQQVYEIQGWTANSKRDPDQVNDNRWRFTGTVAPEMSHYIGQSVAHYRKKGSANPVLYVNIKEKQD